MRGKTRSTSICGKKMLEPKQFSALDIYTIKFAHGQTLQQKQYSSRKGIVNLFNGATSATTFTIQNCSRGKEVLELYTYIQIYILKRERECVTRSTCIVSVTIKQKRRQTLILCQKKLHQHMQSQQTKVSNFPIIKIGQDTGICRLQICHHTSPKKKVFNLESHLKILQTAFLNFNTTSGHQARHHKMYCLQFQVVDPVLLQKMLLSQSPFHRS